MLRERLRIVEADQKHKEDTDKAKAGGNRETGTVLMFFGAVGPIGGLLTGTVAIR